MDSPVLASQDAVSRPEWYHTWFDSPYYHLLYRNHSAQEAEAFGAALLDQLDLPPAARVLDLACGQGRFSRFLAQRGFDVTGVDLSPHSIEYARAFENDHLSFFVHDMRQAFRINYFAGIFNFFTSFGYFDHPRDDYRTLRAVASGLKKGGIFVLDFLNAPYVREYLQPYEERTIDGVHFTIQREVKEDRVFKQISVEDGDENFYFEEKVKFFSAAAITQLGEQVGLHTSACYGDYHLSPYDPAHSPRLIIILKK